MLNLTRAISKVIAYTQELAESNRTLRIVDKFNPEILIETVQPS